jgi:hypothetical protein
MQFVRSTQESIDLNQLRTPAEIIAASGMATGGITSRPWRPIR